MYFFPYFSRTLDFLSAKAPSKRLTSEQSFPLLFHMLVLESENIILLLHCICVGNYFLSQYAVLKTEE